MLSNISAQMLLFIIHISVVSFHFFSDFLGSGMGGLSKIVTPDFPWALTKISC